MKITDSIVNNVSVVTEFGNTKHIKKKFQNRAIKTFIKVPVQRSEVEFVVNRILTEMLNDKYRYIAVPEIISYDRKNHEILFEFIEGNSLINCSKKDFPPTHVWKELLSLINSFLTADIEKLKGQFLGLETTMEECKNIIYNYKFACMNLDHSNQKTLCLGDLNLSNLIWSNEKLYLLDFEFAHFGSLGYDFGQLLGHAEIRFGIEMNELISNDLDIIYWKEKFKNYYSTKKI